MDTTHFKQRFAVGLNGFFIFKTHLFSIFSLWKNQYYFEAISGWSEKSIEIQSITCKGRKGLLNAYPHIPTQCVTFTKSDEGYFI